MILHHEFIRTAKANSKKMAIIDKMRNSNVPYSRALIGALILAKKFSRYNEKHVGIMIPTSAGAMLATIGALMAGKIPVMINYSTGAADNCLYAQKKCDFKTIITSRALLEKINCPVVDGMVCIEDIMTGVSGLDKIKAALKTKLPANIIINSLPKTDKEDTAAILFTSGSEKDPKAVQLSHNNIWTNLRDSYDVLEITKDDIIFSVLPLFHVFGIQTNFWLPLIKGFTAVTYANPLDYKTCTKFMREEQCTMIAATPIFLAGYLRASKKGDFEKLTLVIAGADKTPAWLREDYKSIHDIDILEGYGATETSPVVSVNRRLQNRPGSIGLVIPSAEVKIVDLETGETLPTGKEGKLMVKGDCVMKGYMDQEKTKEVITDGWYYTGDIGMFDKDGFLWHKGRYKRFVKIGGEMVSIVKTEGVLATLVDHDTDICVVEEADDMKGASLTAVLTKEVDKTTLIKEMSKELPAIAIPKKFITIEELPKMGSGKIDFRKVTEIVKGL